MYKSKYENLKTNGYNNLNQYYLHMYFIFYSHF